MLEEWLKQYIKVNNSVHICACLEKKLNISGPNRKAATGAALITALNTNETHVI